MTTSVSCKLQVLWDYFIHAEPQSYEKSSWLDLFLAEILIQVRDGNDINEILSFCSMGGSGVSTLVACELLSDVHDLCVTRNDGGELPELSKYLIQGRGWRSLAVLHLLGVRGLSCGRELVALLVALYPVALQKTTVPIPHNPYVRFHSNDNTVDTVDIIAQTKKQNRHQRHHNTTNVTHFNRTNEMESRKRNRKHSISNNRAQTIKQKEKNKNKPDASSESEVYTDGIDYARSLTLKIRLNPMDFEYFTCVVRSDEERGWTTALYQTSRQSISNVTQDLIDERISAVLECSLNQFETSLLIIQLLQSMRDYDTPAEQTPAVQMLKFALDTLWSLQFGTDAVNLTRIQCATLKAAAARLMLTALERVLRADEPTTAVIHNGLLPMTLRLLEDACSKPMVILCPEEGSLTQEFIFATTYGIITFLYSLLHQRGTIEKLGDFLQLFQLFTESQDGKLIERTILTIVELPSIDSMRSTTRARKVIDMIGALISALKRIRHELANVGESHKNYHHSDILGIAYSQPIVGSIAQQTCCISSLFMILIALLKESTNFDNELQVRLVKVITAAGTCCCFTPKILLLNIINFIKSQKHCKTIYMPTIGLLERCLYKELGALTITHNTCNVCVKDADYSWDFLQLYKSLLTPECPPNLCYIIMSHLLRVTPMSNYQVRREMLFGIFYPVFIKAKQFYRHGNNNSTVEFIIQSCFSIIPCLIINNTVYDRFVALNGLEEALELFDNPLLTRSICNLIQVSVIMEMCSLRAETQEIIITEGSAMKYLFDILERETTCLLELLKTEEFNKIFDESTNQQINCRSGTVSFLAASTAWRATAGVALCSPAFRIVLSKNSIAKQMFRLFNILAISIATDRIPDLNKSAHRLLEALITCCLTSPLYEFDVIRELGNTLINTGLNLGRGIAALVDGLLRAAMIRPSQEQTVLQLTRPRLPIMAPDSPTDCGVDDSSTGEYVTADDGYEADNEIQGTTSLSNLPKRRNSLGPAVESRGNANANPALCTLAIDLLIHFAQQGLDGERSVIVSGGLRKIAATCRESGTSCAALAGSGAITKLLNGFETILTSISTQDKDLQNAVLDVFTLLATQSITPDELVSYLSLFKIDSPPLLPLLEPLYRLVTSWRPQPNFILSFPTILQCQHTHTDKQERGNSEKADLLVNNFRKNHLSSGVCSPWSVHAVCLPVGPELAWSAWLHGCAASMWLRIERGSLLSGRGPTVSVTSPFDSESESLSEWGVLSDNWNREVTAGSTSPPTPATIIHLMSIGFESLVLEMWLDLRSDKLILRLTRPDDKINRTISETNVNGVLSSGRWHHLAMNIKDKVLNKKSAVVEVIIWVDGWREVSVQLPFDGLLVRKPSTTCILLGQVGPSVNGAWYLGNLMLFRCPIITKERALYLASLGPNYTNLADCILNCVKPNFAPLIASGALTGVREVKFQDGKFDTSRRKSYGGTYFRHMIETNVVDSKINWDTIMDATNSYLCELQDSILLCYEAQSPNIVHLYPQAIANPGAVVRHLFPGQPGFRAISAPEHRVSQQPPMSIAVIAPAQFQRQQYRGLVPAATLTGGIPIFLYLFARIVELNSSQEEQALALSVLLNLAKSDAELLNQYRSEGGHSLILRILESSRCHAGKHMLKAILDATCDNCILVRDIASDNHTVLQSSEAVITDPELIKQSLGAWRTWLKFNTLNLFLQALLMLLRDQHSQREFNAAQLNRVGLVDTILLLCKEHFMYKESGAILDITTGTAVVELVRALMGAPPEFSHLVAITDYLVLVHQATDTYVTHSRHNMYFLLTSLEERTNTKIKTTRLISSSDESLSPLEMSKLNKARMNVETQRERANKRERHGNAGPSRETSAGEDSGIAASDGSNHHTSINYTTRTDEKSACQGLVCEGLVMLLRDALRILPDNQVGSVLKHVIRIELLIVLLNNSDPRVRTALIKVIQAYLQREADDDTNKFIKQKYFWHIANQVSLYVGSEQLVASLESLAARGPILDAMPPLLAILTKSASTDPNIVRPILAFITDIIAKNSNSLRVLLEQGLFESLAQALVGASHRSNASSILNDIHILLIGITTKLLESPGHHLMQTITDLHTILNHVELNERSRCGPNVVCISAIRNAQVVVFDGELDTLMSKITTHPGFKLRSTASYLASATYLTTILSTWSDQSDHESRTSSYGSSNHTTSSQSSREPSRGEINERFRTILFKAVDFVMSADYAPTINELQLAKRLFTILLHGLSSPLDRKNNWSGSWSSRPVLRKNTAKMMVWLLGPHQSNNTRVYAVRSLMEEPRGREILSSLLEVHPQIVQKFTVFFWDLIEKKNEMPSADARVCIELKEALEIWQLVKGLKHTPPELLAEELALLRRDLIHDREVWLENNLPAIQRISHKFDALAKQLTESAMIITQVVIEEQSRERKVLLEKLKHSRAMEAQAVARWRELMKRLTHERAPWFMAKSYPTSWELDPTEGPARVRIRMQRCHLKIDKKFVQTQYQDKLDAVNIEGPLSYLFTDTRQDVNTTDANASDVNATDVKALKDRLHTSERIRKMSQARVVTPQAELPGEALIGETCVYFIPDKPHVPLHTDIALGGLDLAMAGGTAWKLEDIRELHPRRYQLQEIAIEIFLTTGRTYLLAFNSSRERDEFTSKLSTCNLPQRVRGDDLGEAIAAWRSGHLTNWEYIMCLNKLAGRSYNDLMQYPVFPFVLADYISKKIDLNNEKIYRNFQRPMAIQDKKNEQHYIHNYNYLKQALADQEPYHYGSHYSNSGTVLHFLVRLPPFTSMFLCYQDNNFDIPDRTFHALATTWRLTSCDSTTDVKELIPEFFYLPEFLLNTEGFNFGVRQNGCQVGDVELPAWCNGDARLFVLAHRAALESDIVRENLPYWIDLVFGFRQTGKPAVEAINVFHPATYYGFNVDDIADPLERNAWETMIRTYGQTPAQLFTAAHPLPIHNSGNSSISSSIPSVIEGVDGIKWGTYVGAPGNEPIICWKHKHRAPIASLVPLTTGDVFGLPVYTTLLLGYNKEKGINMLGGTSVLGVALASWAIGSDGIVRLKSKKDQPPKPLIHSSGLDPITVLGSTADCGQLWFGHLSGKIMVNSYNIETNGKIQFTGGPASVLLAHRCAIKVIAVSRTFSIAVTGDAQGVIVIWDLNSLSYVRSIICEAKHAITHLAISETLGDIAVTCQLSSNATSSHEYGSELRVFTINARPVGAVLSRREITALCYSNAPEGMSVNVIATGLDNGVIRLWSSWDLRLVREIVNGGTESGAILAIAWSCDQHHLYAATADSTILIWEGMRRLNSGTPKFVNLT